jgi:TetR/AcrR family transcriptional repressor of nem operon
LCVAFSTGRDSFGENVLSVLKQFHEESIHWLTEVFETGLRDGTLPNSADPREEAVGCLATVEGAQLLARASKDTTLFDQAIARLKSQID